MKLRTFAGSLLLALAALPTAQAGTTVMAAWERHEVELTYVGFTTLYTCDGLADKTRLLLRHLGARPDFKVTSRGCIDTYRVSPFPRVKLVFYAPAVPATGQKDVGEPVPAAWQKIAIGRGEPRDLELGDCELVEQFRDKVLPLFGTRNLVDDMVCIPHQLSGSRISLQFEVLRGVTSADAARRPPIRQ